MTKALEYYKSAPVIVIYHGNCADGFGAAYAVRNHLGEDGIEYHAGVYQQTPPDVKGKHVVMVDFSYKPEVVQSMRADALSILVLDHHKSAMESFEEFDFGNGYWSMSEWTGGDINFDRFVMALYQDNCENCPFGTYAYFDMKRSGAMIAWEFFNKEPAPKLFHHIQDRDLWQFKLAGTREIQAAVFSNPYDFGVWDILIESELGDLVQDGAAIERKHFKDIAELLKVCQRTMKIGGHEVPVVSLPYTMASDAGHTMSKGKPFAACYWDTPTHRIFSLRSNEEGIDVSIVALGYGGGGHRNAAGFSVPREHELASS
jgi:oligoribonuclease NrnB/cAMP/cGMP phosphodiesterase (DHH superfamily)